MPAIVTFKKYKFLKAQWNASSDDCVLPTVLSIAVGLFNLSLLSAALCLLYLRPVCFKTTIPPLLYGPLLSLLAIKTAIQLNEGLILIYSSRGTIRSNVTPRKPIIKIIYVRIILALLELIALVTSLAGVFHPSVTSIVSQCSDFSLGLHFIQGVVAWLVFIYLAFITKVLYCIDPLGCFSPGLLEYLPLFDKSDNRGSMVGPTSPNETFVVHPELADKKKSRELSQEFQAANRIHIWTRRRERFTGRISLSGPSVEQLEQRYSRVHNSNVSTRKIQRRLKAICCCLGVTGQRSRGAALEDVARGLYTVFDETDVALTDVVAGFVLTKQSQRKKMNEGKSLTDKFRRVTFRMMPSSQRYGRDPETLKPDKPFDFSKLDDQIIFEDLVHYMHYAMGVYGWPLYVFNNMACGLCELGAATCCRCKYRCFVSRSKTDFPQDDCCLCAVGALRLSTGLDMEDILYVSLENKIYKAPFSVCCDHKRKAVVVSVRGTLSLKDTLTDMSFTPIHVTVHPIKETYVHGGMLRAAIEIHKAINELELLDKAFKDHEDYQLVVAGHSLGAGVASILSLLFKLENKYPTMACYAYSPPGCLFSFPLAIYCKDFITSVVLGNDMVPRLTLRSLLHLKFTVADQLIICDKPKYRVLFENKLFSHLFDILSARPTLQYTPSVPTDGTYGEDTVDSGESGVGSDGGAGEGGVGSDGGAGEGGVSGGVGGDIEDRVVNMVTTNDWLRDQLFKREASIQPDTGVQRRPSRFFSRSPSTQPSRIGFTHRMQRAVSVQPPRLDIQPPSLATPDGQGVDEVDTDFPDGVIPASFFQGTENDINPSALATPGTLIHNAIPQIHQHCRAHDGESFLPLFPGGRVVHIEMVMSKNKNICSCLSRTEYSATVVPNDKLCVIQIDHGIVDHHLPTHVLAALKECQTNLLLTDPQYNPQLTEQKRLENAAFRKKLHRATNRKVSLKTGFNFVIDSPMKPTQGFPGKSAPNTRPSGLLHSLKATKRDNKLHVPPRHNLITTTTNERTSEQLHPSELGVFPNHCEGCGLSKIEEEAVEDESESRLEVKVEVHREDDDVSFDVTRKQSREELFLPLREMTSSPSHYHGNPFILPNGGGHESTV